MGRRWSLRTRFVLVAVACLLPLLGAILYVLYQSATYGRDRLLGAQQTTAEVVAQVLGATLDENRGMLDALAAEPVVRKGEPDAEGALRQFHQANPTDLSGLFLVRPDHTVVATAGLETPLPTGIGPVVDQALGPDGLGVSNRLMAEGGEDVVAIAVPVLSRDQAEGQPNGAVGAILSVDQLESTVLPFARDERVIAIVGDGEVIATRANNDAVDRQALADGLRDGIAQAAGSISAVAYEDGTGAARLGAYAPVDVPGAGWAAFVTQPAPPAFAPNRMLLAEGLGALALALAAAVALAVAAGEWVGRPVRGLTEQAVALTEGDFTPRPTAARGGELGALGAAFRAMADRFATQVHDLEAAREENAARAEQLRELNRRTVRLQEDERRRIAAEMHDAVAPLITGALYQARALRLADAGAPGGPAADDPARVADGLDAVGDLLARAMAELHDVIFDLRPPDLDDLGVVAAIERYAAQIQRSGLTCRLEVEGEPPSLTPEVRLAIYRIVQEALHNALRHAAADEAVVRLETEDGTLRVTVRDNGAGFDPARAARPSSLGLLSMRERATAIGASFAVTSRPGDGTTVVIERRLEADAPVPPLAPDPALPLPLAAEGVRPAHDGADRAPNGAHDGARGAPTGNQNGAGHAGSGAARDAVPVPLAAKIGRG